MAKYNLWEMDGLDIFLQSLSETEREKYREDIVPKPNLSNFKGVGLPSDFFKPETPKTSQQKDLDSLSFMASQFYWKTDFTKILENKYDALIVTDFSQKIIWTNPGFLKMTGYSQSYAIGKKPSFLQGAETSAETRLSIKYNLSKGKPFIEKILNYKKNEKPYWCKINIFPMESEEGIIHFLALETEVL